MRKVRKKRKNKKQEAVPTEDYSYYSYEPSDDDKEAQRELQRTKDRAKFRGARPDLGDSSDGQSSPHNSPLKDARQKSKDDNDKLLKWVRRQSKELHRSIKAARNPAATKRPHGSAVANRSKTGA